MRAAGTAAGGLRARCGADDLTVADRTATATSSETRGLLWRAFTGDGVLVFSTLAVLVVSVLQSGSLVPSELFNWYQGLVVVLVISIWALRSGLRRITDTTERRFWNRLVFAFFGFLIAELFRTVFYDAYQTIHGRLFQELCYLAYYLLLLFAIELQAHRVIPESESGTWRSRKRFEIEGAILFVAGLVVSFVLIPMQAGDDYFTSPLPSSFLYLSLDLLILARTVQAYRDSLGVRWRTIYRCLILAEVIMLLTDFADLLSYASLYDAPPASYPVWYLYFLLFILAGRLRHFLPPVDASESAEKELGDRLSGDPFSNILLIYTLLLPALHLVFDYFALFNSAINRQQIPIVLIYVVAFLYILGRQHKFEESRNQALETQVAQRQAVVVKQRDQLLQTNAELERLTYTVNHDLKSPLVTILGFVGMLEKDMAEGDPERMKSDIRRIRNAASKMGQMVDELVDLSRIGPVDNEPQAVSLDELTREAVELVAGRIRENNVKVVVSPDLPVVSGDRLRLLTVFQNLIDNATKYRGSQAEPRVEIGVRQGAEGPIYYVEDNGLGIDARYHQKIFDLFDQLDPRIEGTGIGLAAVKRIIELHGGQIWVESDGLGKGSTFCFTLPHGHAAHGESVDQVATP